MQKRRGLLSDYGVKIETTDDHLRSKYNKQVTRGVTEISRWLLLLLLLVFGPILLFLRHHFEVLPTIVEKIGNVSPIIETSNESTASSSFSQETHLRSLRFIDRDQFTIRIMTFRRNDQLLVSLNHHSSCPGVALIQVIWCDQDNFPPLEILYHKSSKVVVEFHSINSLNERFNILSKNDAWKGWSTHPKNPDIEMFQFLETPTLGILSIDDDVMRPCEAIDAGFFRWTKHPDRIVGFDARIHSVQTLPDERHTEVWAYGYLSQVRKKNKYSLTLPRYCFIHRDYLHMYMTSLPRKIFNLVEEQMNCEDIAMSFFVSSKTQGRLPLLADLWAMEAMVKLKSSQKISASSNHKAIRDSCVDSFSELLGLKNANVSFNPETIVDSNTRNWFGVGVDHDDWTFGDNSPLRWRELYGILQNWEQKKVIQKKVKELIVATAHEALQKGLLDK